MNTILKLFNRTFIRVPKMQECVHRLSGGIKQIEELYDLQQRARLFYLSKLIMEEVKQLQGNKSLEIISRFNQKYLDIQYNYQNNMFQMNRNIGDNSINYQIKSMYVEKFDHPFFRQTLYFHQLKNADKYMNIEVPKFFPKYMQDGYRKMAIDNALDTENPLGVPEWANPLSVTVEVKRGEIVCGFDLFSKLGKTMISRCYNMKKQYTFERDPMYFSESFYKFIIQFLEVKGGIDKIQMQEMYKLTYIGGSVQKLELMINLFNIFYSQQINK